MQLHKTNSLERISHTISHDTKMKQDIRNKKYLIYTKFMKDQEDSKFNLDVLMSPREFSKKLLTRPLLEGDAELKQIMIQSRGIELSQEDQ